MDKYKKADRRLASLLNVVNQHWTESDDAIQKLRFDHGVHVDMEDDCCCAHTGGPVRNWIWFHDHADKDRVMRFAVVVALIHKFELQERA